MRRLSRSVLSELPPSVRQPQYDRETLQIGIAHIGVGAFHRCHQAEFIDDMLEARFGRWGVLGVNLMAEPFRSPSPARLSLFPHAAAR
jgi:fructuronate reductase